MEIQRETETAKGKIGKQTERGRDRQIETESHRMTDHTETDREAQTIRHADI